MSRVNTLPKTSSSPLKIKGYKMKFPFWDGNFLDANCYLQGGCIYQFKQNSGYTRWTRKVKIQKNMNIKYHPPPKEKNLNTVPETNSSHLKIGGWKTSLSFWVSAHFQGVMPG